MAKDNNKEPRKLTSGQAAFNSKQDQPAEHISIIEREDRINLEDTMSLDLQEDDESGLEISRTETAESHAADESTVESQRIDDQTAKNQVAEEQTTGLQASDDNPAFSNDCTPAATSVIDEDGSRQLHNEDQAPRPRCRTPPGVRQAIRARQTSFRVYPASNRSERAARGSFTRSRQREAIQAAEDGEESTLSGQNSGGSSNFLARAGRTSRVLDHSGRSNNSLSTPEARIQDIGTEQPPQHVSADVFQFPQYSTQNGSFVSQYNQSGGPMPFQYRQNAQLHHYQSESDDSTDFVPGLNQGQMQPPQYRSPYSEPDGHDMPNNAPQQNQNPYLQPYNFQSYNGIGQPPGLPYANRSANARVNELDPRSNGDLSQSTVGGPQRAFSAEREGRYDDTECLWPSHLSVEERHARGIFTREELRERSMAPPPQTTRRSQTTRRRVQRARRISPATYSTPNPEESNVASAEGVEPEAMDEESTDIPALVNIHSAIENEPDEMTGVSTPAGGPILVGTRKGWKVKKRAGSPLTGSSQAAPKKPRIFHGDLHQQPDGTVWFRAPGSTVSEPTVRHEPNRAAMIADASARGYYVHAPAMGTELPDDTTSYLEAQREWYCGDRPHDWHPSLGLLYQFQRGDRPLRSGRVGPLRWRGNVVLNNRNEVMTDWPDLPMTLSSALEGYRLEMYSRLDQRITINDMLDRMPSAQDGSRAVVPSALSNRRSRFRERNGLVSWDHRDGTAGFLTTVRARLTPQQLANNSTKGFLGLSELRLKEIKDKNREQADGRYAKKAGKKALAPEEREAREARQRTRLNARGRLAELEPSDQSESASQQDQSEPATAGYPHRTDEEDEFEDEDLDDGGLFYEEGDGEEAGNEDGDENDDNNRNADDEDALI